MTRGNNSNSKKKGQKGRKDLLNCPVCTKKIDESGDALQCEFCEVWVCLACTKMSKAVYDAINETEGADNFIWACTPCKAGIPNLKAIKKAVENNNQEIKKLDKTVNSMNEEIRQLVIGEIKASTEKGAIRDLVCNTVKEAVDEQLLEREERVKRETNLIFFNVKESGSEHSETREKEDVATIKNVCSSALGIDHVGITKCMRLGKKGGNFPRPVKVVLENKEQRPQILRKAKELKGHTEF